MDGGKGGEGKGGARNATDNAVGHTGKGGARNATDNAVGHTGKGGAEIATDNAVGDTGKGGAEIATDTAAGDTGKGGAEIATDNAVGDTGKGGADIAADTAAVGGYGPAKGFGRGFKVKQYAIGSGPKFTWMSKAAATNHMFVERYKNSGQNMTRAETERALANLMTDDLGPNGARRYLVPIGD